MSGSTRRVDGSGRCSRYGKTGLFAPRLRGTARLKMARGAAITAFAQTSTSNCRNDLIGQVVIDIRSAQAHQTTNLQEGDSPFPDEPARKMVRDVQVVGSLFDSQQVTRGGLRCSRATLFLAQDCHSRVLSCRSWRGRATLIQSDQPLAASKTRSCARPSPLKRCYPLGTSQVHSGPPLSQVVAVNPRMVRRLVESRRIAFVKVGRHVRFRECDLVTVMKAWTIQPVNRSR